MNWTDDNIDKLFRDAADKQSIPYDQSYWKEFEHSLPAVETGWSDTEIDRLFKSEARDQEVAYKDSYWREFEELLPVERKRDVLWYFFAFTFVSVLGVMMMGKKPDSVNTAQNAMKTESKEQMGESGTLATEPAESSKKEGSSVHSNVYSTEGQHVGNADANRTGGTMDINPVSHHNVIGAEVSEPLVPENVETIDIAATGTEVPVVEDGTVEVIGESTTESDLYLEQLPNRPLTPFAFEAASLTTLNFREVPKRPLYSLYVQGVGGVSQSFITPSDKLSYNAGFGLGLRILSGRFSYNAGLNAVMSVHEDLELNRMAKVYGFGSTLYQYHLNYEHLYTLEGDFGVSYMFRRSAIKFGVRPSVLMSTRVEISTSDVKSDPSIIENSETRLNYGFNEGIRKFGIKPMIGYSYLLSRSSLEFGANIGIQLMPMVNEDYINGKNNSLPVDGQVYVRKYIHLSR